MSDNIKLIIEIPKDYYEIIKHDVENNLTDYRPFEIIGNGIPLDDVKAKIETDLSWEMYDDYGNETGLHKELMKILDSVGKESEENNESNG